MLEFCDSDLEALIKAKGVVLSPGDIKAYMSMLLQALQACHQHWILHRDVKPNNMLISRDGAPLMAAEAVYWLCGGVVVAGGLSLHSKKCMEAAAVVEPTILRAP